MADLDEIVTLAKKIAAMVKAETDDFHMAACAMDMARQHLLPITDFKTCPHASESDVWAEDPEVVG